MPKTMLDSGAASIYVPALILGHSKVESTVHYLGIELDDALEKPKADEKSFERLSTTAHCPTTEILGGLDLITGFDPEPN